MKGSVSVPGDKATGGGALSVSPVHTALVEKPGREVAVSMTKCLPVCHGWRKV